MTTSSSAEKSKQAPASTLRWKASTSGLCFCLAKLSRGREASRTDTSGLSKETELKVRGIEHRRHDTPEYFKKCQGEILEKLELCNNEQELRECANTSGVQIFEEYAKDLENHRVSPLDLMITRQLSKNPGEYSSKRQLQVNAALKLENEGLKLQAGQSISYVITRYESKGRDRSYPREFANENYSNYDSKRYIELLADCCASVLDPLGVSKEMLLTRAAMTLS